MNFGKVIASLKKLLTQGWILVQTPKLGVYKESVDGALEIKKNIFLYIIWI